MASKSSTARSGRALEGLRRLRNPIVVFGSILIVVAWIVAEIKLRSDRETLVTDSISDLTNFSLLFEQDVLRTASDLDRTIKYLRHAYERSGINVDWPALVQEDFTVNNRTAQIAIIDEHGFMITSSAMPRPKQLVDLSDREHFRVHLNGTADVLFVSKPILGRASGKWSVQFTRRFAKRDGSFGGVIVVSLDPARLIAAYESLQSLPSVGFALAGRDDVIRAGAGYYAKQMGRGLVEGSQQEFLPTKTRGVQIMRELIDGTWRISAERPVGDLSLMVRVSANYPVQVSWSIWHPYYGYAAFFSLAILAVMIGALTRQRQHIQRITEIAHSDSLTMLPNRYSFQQTMAAKFDGGIPLPSIALHLIDLDLFKSVNDTFGHPVGDDLLRSVAKRLRKCVRDTDELFRLGGDEFALIQDGCDSAEKAATVAARLCLAMAEPFSVGGHQLHIGSSIGVALVGADLQNSTTLLKAADIALYLAKDGGRGTFRFYNAEVDATQQRRRQLENDLRDAIEAGSLEIHYQPKVLLAERARVIGFEALIRWNHPTLGMIPPLDFIPLAEETGLIQPLGAWIVSEVCKELARRPGHETVAVNCSPIQFIDGKLVQTITSAIAKSGIGPARLEIEITESTLMRDDKKIVAQLAELRAQGILISLDDFGTGYSSLSYLEKYPIDCIKIDRSFVGKLGEEPRAAAIIRAIINLAAHLDMTTIAEGVETKAQAEILRALGCTMAQGYYFGRPRRAEDAWGDETPRAQVA